MVHERIEILVSCDNQEEYDIALRKLLDYGYECTPNDEPFAFLAARNVSMTIEEV